MGTLTDDAAAVSAAMMFGRATNTFPTTYYLGLSSTALADNGTGHTEPTGGSYARVVITNSAPNFTVQGRGVVNGTSFVFPEALEDWGDYDYFFLADGDDVVWAWGSFDTTMTINTNDILTFAPGDLSFTVAGA